MEPKERFNKFNEFPGREMASRVSRDERIFYLEKLRAKARAGNTAAMGEIVRCEQMNSLKKQLITESLIFDRTKGELVDGDGLSEQDKAQWVEETE